MRSVRHSVFSTLKSRFAGPQRPKVDYLEVSTQQIMVSSSIDRLRNWYINLSLIYLWLSGPTLVDGCLVTFPYW